MIDAHEVYYVIDVFEYDVSAHDIRVCWIHKITHRVYTMHAPALSQGLGNFVWMASGIIIDGSCTGMG